MFSMFKLSILFVSQIEKQRNSYYHSSGATRTALESSLQDIFVSLK